MDSRLKHLDWSEHLSAILSDYKENLIDEALDGDEVDNLTEIIRAKLNLLEGNITHDEYCDMEIRLIRGGTEGVIELSRIQKKMLKEKCPACGEGELHAIQGNGDEGENYLWCNKCDCSVDSTGGYTN